MTLEAWLWGVQVLSKLLVIAASSAVALSLGIKKASLSAAGMARLWDKPAGEASRP